MVFLFLNAWHMVNAKNERKISFFWTIVLRRWGSIEGGWVPPVPRCAPCQLERCHGLSTLLGLLESQGEMASGVAARGVGHQLSSRYHELVEVSMRESNRGQ